VPYFSGLSSPRAADRANAFRISVRGFLSSPLVVLSKRPKLTRNSSVGHGFGSTEQGPRDVQIFFAQHIASRSPA
jgi:hypothetical protein